MKIKIPTTALERLLAHHTIYIYCDDLKLIDKLVKEVDIDIEQKPYKSQKGKLLSISPVGKYQSFKYDSLPEILKDKDNDSYKMIGTKSILIPDFQGSNKFYKYLSKKGTPKILSDYYSFERSKLLYKYIAKIETFFREIFIETYEQEEYKPQKYQSKSPDHPISQFSTYEFIIDKLLALSNREYFLKHVKDTNDNKKMEARNSTKIDELDIKISRDDLIKFSSIRNAVMHFRVVTAEDTIFVLKLAARIDQDKFKKLSVKIAKNNQ